MLELPELFTITSQLNATVQGKIIDRVVVAHSPHRFTFYFGDPADYSAKLIGKIWGPARVVGMFAEVRIEPDTTFLFHDGVNVRYLTDLAQVPAKHQLLIVFTDQTALVFTVQMYGGLMVFTDQEIFENEYYQTSLSKPSPLSADFNEAYFDQIVASVPPQTSLKALLATQQRIPGLGNGVLQDILFNARLHPQTKVALLSPADRHRLFHSLKSTLQKMTDQGGRDTEKDLFGQPGGYKTLLSSKTLNQPCPDCGGWPVKKAYLGGSIYFCPACQPIV